MDLKPLFEDVRRHILTSKNVSEDIEAIRNEVSLFLDELHRDSLKRYLRPFYDGIELYLTSDEYTPKGIDEIKNDVLVFFDNLKKYDDDSPETLRGYGIDNVQEDTCFRGVTADWIRQYPPVEDETTADYYKRYCGHPQMIGKRIEHTSQFGKYVRAGGFETRGANSSRRWRKCVRTEMLADTTDLHATRMKNETACKGGLIYIVDSPLSNGLKIGKSTQDVNGIARRYVTPLGNMITIHTFESTDIDTHEKAVHALLAKHRLCLELFHKDCISEAIRLCEMVCGFPCVTYEHGKKY